MSLAAFDCFLKFAEATVASKPNWPSTIDAPELESALVGYGVVLLHSHMEQCVRKAVEIRCSQCDDVGVRAYAISIAEEKTGRIAINELSRTLRRFGTQSQSAFERDLVASGLNSSWDSIIHHRKNLAHSGRPASLTLADLRFYFEGIRKVLGFYCNALGLSRIEIEDVSTLIDI